MRTEASREGYLLIDHRASPGIDELTARRLNIPYVPEGKTGEFKTLTCKHCKGSWYLNPLRTRDRARCPECFRYICDGCADLYKITGECVTIEDPQELVVNDQTSIPLVLRG